MKNVGSLMKGLKEKKVPCRISGCTNSWMWAGEEQLKAMASGNLEPPQRMCERCFEIFRQIDDREIKCANPDCENTWKYNRIAQVADQINGRTEPPRRLCMSCQTEGTGFSPIELPCKISGCENTWIWTPMDQMVHGSDNPPSKMCDSCYGIFKSLKDLEIECKVRGCNGKWLWTRISQLESHLKGRKTPPRKLCNSCSEIINSLEDKVVNCRVEECNNTWVWTRFSQLEASVSGHDITKAPQRMCPDCSTLYSQVSDINHPCRIPECNGSWTEKRGSVFARKINNQAAPKRLCDECYHELENYSDLELPCKFKKFGCTGSWLLKKETQLRIFKKSGDKDFSDQTRACISCEKFLRENGGSIEIVCRECGEFIISLSAEDNLRIKLGTREKPENLCEKCRPEKSI